MEYTESKEYLKNGEIEQDLINRIMSHYPYSKDVEIAIDKLHTASHGVIRHYKYII